MARLQREMQLNSDSEGGDDAIEVEDLNKGEESDTQLDNDDILSDQSALEGEDLTNDHAISNNYFYPFHLT